MVDGYLGIESVRHGNSGACIEDIFRIHFANARSVADVTFGKGRFWRWPDQTIWTPDVISLDADPRGGARVVADYRFVPLKDQSVDVVVFDPPFIFTPGIRRIVGSKRFFLGSEERVRFNEDDRIQRAKNPTELMGHTMSVMREARRVARHGCILKGQDLIVDKPYWWSFATMANIQAWWGMMPEDMLIQVSPAPRLNDPRWKKQYHFRRRHAIYLVYRWSS